MAIIGQLIRFGKSFTKSNKYDARLILKFLCRYMYAFLRSAISSASMSWHFNLKSRVLIISDCMSLTSSAYSTHFSVAFTLSYGTIALLPFEVASLLLSHIIAVWELLVNLPSGKPKVL